MADIIHKEATNPSEDAPNQVVTVNVEQIQVKDLFGIDIVLDDDDDAALWVFGVGGPA
jgi:hypothetical protein